MFAASAHSAAWRPWLGRLGGPGLVLAVGLVSIGLLGPYQQFIVGVWAVYSLAALGLLFPAGWIGEISVGHAGILAIGAYTAAVLGTGGLAGTLVIAGVAGLLAGGVLGLPSLRLRGFGLAIVTLVFGEFVRLSIGATPALGGVGGRFVSVPPIGPIAPPMPWLAGIALVLLAIGLVVAGMARVSPLGRAMRAVRDHEALARAFGCGPELLRIMAFAISGLFCGMAGALLSWLTGYIAPESFNLWLSIYLLAMVVLGGRDELYGPLLGAGLVVFGAEVLRVAGDVQAIAFGLALLLVAWLAPQGLVRLALDPLRLRWRARERRRARPGAVALDANTEPVIPAVLEGKQ